MERVLSWMKRSPLAGPLLFTIVVHLVLFNAALGIDEGGFSMVARFADQPGPDLYGPQFVDRPPLLFVFYGLANDLGRYGTRIVALGAAIALVLATARAAYLLGGLAAARWTAWISAGLSSSALLLAHQLNGEILAGAFIAVSIAAVLEASRNQCGPAARFALGLVAGATAVGAVLIKQNFGDALAFALVFVLWGLVRRHRPSVVVVLGYPAGIAAMAAWAELWAKSHHGVGALAYAMIGIRFDAVHAGATNVFQASPLYLGLVLAVGFGSGVLALAAVLATDARRWFVRLSPIAAAYLAAILVEVVGIFVSGATSQHYLIALYPTVAVAAGVAIVRGSRTEVRVRTLRAIAVVTVVSAALAAPVAAILMRPGNSANAVAASWLRAAAQPGDTMAAPFGDADVIDGSGMAPAYPYSWVLLVRTRDPNLDLLTKTLTGAKAPDWVLLWNTPQSAGFGASANLQGALRSHYRLLGDLCGHPVWLLNGHASRLPLPTSGCP